MIKRIEEKIAVSAAIAVCFLLLKNLLLDNIVFFGYSGVRIAVYAAVLFAMCAALSYKMNGFSRLSLKYMAVFFSLTLLFFALMYLLYFGGSYVLMAAGFNEAAEVFAFALHFFIL